jgi:hypothetical protein
MERSSESGLPIDPVYDDSKLTDFQPGTKPGRPAEYPFARGAYPRRHLDRRFASTPPSRRNSPPGWPCWPGRRPAAESGPRILTSKKAAETADNMIYPLPDALTDDAALGEVCDALPEV